MAPQSIVSAEDQPGKLYLKALFLFLFFCLLFFHVFIFQGFLQHNYISFKLKVHLQPGIEGYLTRVSISFFIWLQ